MNPWSHYLGSCCNDGVYVTQEERILAIESTFEGEVSARVELSREEFQRLFDWAIAQGLIKKEDA